MSYGRKVRIRRMSGRGGGIRTPDILLPKQVRYQTALHPAMKVVHRGELYRPGYWDASAGDGGGDSSRLGGSSSAFLERRTRPLSSASSTLTFTIWPSLR